MIHKMKFEHKNNLTWPDSFQKRIFKNHLVKLNENMVLAEGSLMMREENHCLRYIKIIRNSKILFFKKIINGCYVL